ncbi:MAG: hypothetical protein HN337_02675 [Deltaproteobacteria bacterium]|jgi:nucleoside-triphosphatase THEP1|nr:hypothetical protein [Deltaproteobacteria bacterium]
MIYILCDEINSGKSTFVLGLSKKLAQDGLCIGGWTTPPHIERETKVGHDFVAINDGIMDEPIPYTRPHPFDNSFQWKKYFFSKSAFKKARLLNFNCDLFIVDEIGPLELDDKQGFFQMINKFVEIPQNTLLVLRKGLYKSIPEIIGNAEHALFSLESKEQLANEIINIHPQKVSDTFHT